MKVKVKIIEKEMDGKSIRVALPRLIAIPGLSVEDYRAIQAGRIVEIERGIADDLFKGGFVSFESENESPEKSSGGTEGSE